MKPLKLLMKLLSAIALFYGATTLAAAAPTVASAAASTAASIASAPSSALDMFKVLFGLVVVLGMMFGAVWLMKRFGLAKAGNGGSVKIVGGVSVGNRERVLVLEVADQWIVVGVAPGRVSSLATLPRQEQPETSETIPVTNNFAMWLKQTLEKRNASVK